MVYVFFVSEYILGEVFVSEYIMGEMKLLLLELKVGFLVVIEFRIGILEIKMEEENSLLVRFVDNIMYCEVFICGIEIFFLFFMEI